MEWPIGVSSTRRSNAAMTIHYDPPNDNDRSVEGFAVEIRKATIKAPNWINRGSHHLISWFQRQPESWRQRGPDEPDLASTLDNPATLRYQRSERERESHPGPDGGPYTPWIVELARFPVERGLVGFVVDWTQYLATVAVQGATVFTSSQTWGDPYVAATTAGPFRWILRLDEYTGQAPPWISSLTPITLPGLPCTDLAECRDLHRKPDAYRAPFRLIVPGGYQLRLFFEQETTLQAELSVSSTLTGFVQSCMALESAQNLRRL